DVRAQDMADADHVEIRTYNVIYELTKDVRAAMSGMLAPVYEEVHLGQAEVRATFKVPNVGIIAGCYVTEGKVVRNEQVRILRDDQEIFKGVLTTLKHLKDEKKEMVQGFECGIQVDGFQDFKEGDIIDAFTEKAIARAI
ncbi:MAG: translation initiation factor IF-2, partial [Abditibacteriota bacterium]|nr:translation initiation factor IF-2 [Abditibacteriota bacterium]